MERDKHINEDGLKELFHNLEKLRSQLSGGFEKEFKRDLPFEDLVFDRWERAKSLGFGEGSSIYQSSIVFLPTKVGSNCWIGPNTILDGSGGLEIGDHCTISAGVHIYSHDNVKNTLSGGGFPIERAPTAIGSRVYIGPNSIITKGVNLGDLTVVATGAFVNKSFESHSIIAGQPAKKIGEVIIQGNQIRFDYKD